MQNSIEEWERILTQNAVGTRVHGKKSAMYPYTVEVRWNSTVEEQVLHDDVALLSIETQKLQCYIDMLEQHLRCLPERADVPSAVQLVRDIESHLTRIVPQ